jgi:hypothetical protein
VPSRHRDLDGTVERAPAVGQLSSAFGEHDRAERRIGIRAGILSEGSAERLSLAYRAHGVHRGHVPHQRLLPGARVLHPLLGARQRIGSPGLEVVRQGRDDIGHARRAAVGHRHDTDASRGQERQV